MNEQTTGESNMKPIPTTLRRFEYCPGNGTRYDLLFGLTGGGDLLLVWLYNEGAGGFAFHRSAKNNDTLLHHSYLSEKMGVKNLADIAALLAFLAQYGTCVGMPQDFNDDGLYAPRPILVVGGEE
jgi:hypothetical protein